MTNHSLFYLVFFYVFFSQLFVCLFFFFFFFFLDFVFIRFSLLGFSFFNAWTYLIHYLKVTKKVYKEESDEENSSAAGAASGSGSDFDDDEDPDKIEVPGKPSLLDSFPSNLAHSFTGWLDLRYIHIFLQDENIDFFFFVIYLQSLQKWISCQPPF